MADPFDLFYLPFRPALDANGIIVAGASLTFYTSGTSTPAPIFADAELTTPLANPLTANAAGVWPAIYIDNSKTYRVVLRDEGGTVLNEVDPYVPGSIGGETGPRGNPGGNVMAIGLFVDAATLNIPTGTDRVQTSGYQTVGFGSAGYSYDATVTTGSATSFVSANGRGFRLNADAATPTDRGAKGTGASAVVDQLGMSRVVADTQASGRYVAGIDSSYWAHPQDAIFLTPGVYDAGDLPVSGNLSPFPSLAVWGIPGSVVVRIPDNEYLFDVVERINRIYCFGITFVGGLGVFRSTYTGVNVNGILTFEKCIFDNYTECAIGNNASDAPYLRVRECTFMCKAGSPGIGVAWGGYADGCILEANNFLRNLYHIKLGPYLSGSTHILRNDFIRWDTTTPRAADVWLVPNSETGLNGTNSGNGTILEGNKYGNENQQAGDVRILVALEGAGATRQTRQHSTVWTPSGSYVTGLSIKDSRVAASDLTNAPFIRSYIGELRNLSYSNNRHDGGLYTLLCEFMGDRISDYANMNWAVQLSPADTVLEGSPWKQGVTNTNALIGPITDTSGSLSMEEHTTLPATGGDDVSFMLFATADTAAAFNNGSNGTYAGATLATVNDPSGFARAVEVTVPTSTDPEFNAGIYLPLGSGPAANRQCWVHVVLARGTTNSAAAVRVWIENQATGKRVGRAMRYVLPADYRKARFSFELPEVASDAGADAWQLKISSIDYSPTANRFRVASAYLYQGREPMHDGHIRTLGDGKWNGGHLIMGTTHFWEEAGKLYMKVGAPTSGTDGTLVGAQV